MRKQLIPWDVRNECLWIVRGYRRRLREYQNARQEILTGASCGYIEVTDPESKTGEKVRIPTVRSGGESRTTEEKALRLEALERTAEVKRMRAVEKAKVNIGDDITNIQTRMKLIDAIVLSCENGKAYPFRTLGLDCFSERDFYRRRDYFLLDIAHELNII